MVTVSSFAMLIQDKAGGRGHRHGARDADVVVSDERKSPHGSVS
jgi:hypothetical protein